MARVTDVSTAGRLRILFLDSDCDVTGSKTILIDGRAFEVIPGLANSAGRRALLADAIAICASREELPDERLVGNEVTFA